MSIVADNIIKVRERIVSACSRAKRSPDSLTIVAVTKTRTIEQIKEALDAGIADIGENRVQEASLKYNALRATQYAQRIKWHMVGHLQTNKVKEAAGIFDLIHSVDSLRLAREIDKQAGLINKVQDVLLEVKTSAEDTKSGLKTDDIVGVIKEITNLKNINIKGLMTIAPLAEASEKARPYFRILKELLDKLNAQRSTQNAIRDLSMGMSDDFEVAIEEGSTIVRLGRVVFEG